MCTSSECKDPMKTYWTLRDFIRHMTKEDLDYSEDIWRCVVTDCHRLFSDRSSLIRHIENHTNIDWFQIHDIINSIKDPNVKDFICPFCQQTVDRRKTRLSRHLARHMEEISYAVVTRPYSGWKFYDESSSGGSIQD